MIEDDDLTDEQLALIGAPPRHKPKQVRARKRQPAPTKTASASYTRPSRGGPRQRRIRIPVFNEMSAIRGEMAKIYKTARLSVGDSFDSLTAKTLIDCLRAIASVKAIEVADELGLLEEMVKAKKGGRA